MDFTAQALAGSCLTRSPVGYRFSRGWDLPPYALEQDLGYATYCEPYVQLTLLPIKESIPVLYIVMALPFK